MIFAPILVVLVVSLAEAGTSEASVAYRRLRRRAETGASNMDWGLANSIGSGGRDGSNSTVAPSSIATESEGRVNSLNTSTEKPPGLLDLSPEKLAGSPSLSENQQDKIENPSDVVQSGSTDDSNTAKLGSRLQGKSGKHSSPRGIQERTQNCAPKPGFRCILAQTHCCSANIGEKTFFQCDHSNWIELKTSGSVDCDTQFAGQMGIDVSST